MGHTTTLLSTGGPIIEEVLAMLAFVLVVDWVAVLADIRMGENAGYMKIAMHRQLELHSTDEVMAPLLKGHNASVGHHGGIVNVDREGFVKLPIWQPDSYVVELVVIRVGVTAHDAGDTASLPVGETGTWMVMIRRVRVTVTLLLDDTVRVLGWAA